MKINRLYLKNYRCFDELDVVFNDSYHDLEGKKPINLHLLLAPNMVGKSAILKALRIATGATLQKIKANPANSNTLNITTSEHRVTGNNPFTDKVREVTIEAEATAKKWNGRNWIDATYKWTKYKEDYSGRHTKTEHRIGDIVADANKGFNRVIENKDGIIPLFLYVGTEYIHQQKAATDSLDQDGSAKQGYWYCLDDKSMEAYVFDWFKKLHRTTIEQQNNPLAHEFYQDFAQTTLTTFKEAVKALLPDILDLGWILNTLSPKSDYVLVFNIEKQGTRTYDMLSDGYKYLVLLAGELVTRATLLNKHIGNGVLSEITGIVLIDEFGIHLHPGLQANTITRLAALLPNVQFIVTTHSPLLVNGLRKEQIHLISELPDGRRKVEHPDEDAIGLGAEGILREMFGIDSTFDLTTIARNEDYKRLLQKRNEAELTPEEEERFRKLSAQLSMSRLDPSLKIVSEDPITTIVKQRMQQEDAAEMKLMNLSPENLNQKVNAILDDIFKPI